MVNSPNSLAPSWRSPVACSAARSAGSCGIDLVWSLAALDQALRAESACRLSACVIAGPSEFVSGTGARIIAHAPLRRPAKRCAKSAGDVASTITTGPVTGPSVPGAQAHDAPKIGCTCGETIVREIGPRSQPRPNVQASVQALSTP